MALLMSSLTMCAQKDVTRFLGIPVDGKKTAMIQKLKEKGFRTNPFEEDSLIGEFNGTEVVVYVVTNNNKVWRIAIFDKYDTDVTNIKIRFNSLCRQFMSNEKYISLEMSESAYIIPNDEDILYNMTVSNKRYEAAFLQKTFVDDFDKLIKQNYSLLSALYSKEELANPTKKQKNDILKIVKPSAAGDVIDENKMVWFYIEERLGGFRINMFYDNKYNKANGQDL